MKDLLRRVYHSKDASAMLKTASNVCSVIGAAVFALMLAFLAFLDPLLSLRFAVCAAVPFVIVTVLRKLINAPRPYELYDFYIEKPKDKKGQSFPSRHVFSAFLIATLAIPTSIPLAAALFTVGICLSVSRVLLGMHFIRDVAAGALIGIISGILGIIII